MLLRLDRKTEAHGVEKREKAFDLRVSPFREHAVEALTAQSQIPDPEPPH
jgi:hypothetical protein